MMDSGGNGRGSARRVLVAEDNEPLASLIEAVLGRAGFDVVVAYDGYSALALAVEQHFDALLTDLQMPGLTGDHVAERVRRIHPNLPILLMTAYLAAEARNLPWAAVIRKPFDPWALVAAIDAATSPNPIEATARSDAGPSRDRSHLRAGDL